MIQPNTTTGWLFASGSSWTLWHTSGSRQDTHGTLVPEKDGRGRPTTCSTRRLPINDDRRRQALRQTWFQETSAVKRETQQPGADRHLESCNKCEKYISLYQSLLNVWSDDTIKIISASGIGTRVCHTSHEVRTPRMARSYTYGVCESIVLRRGGVYGLLVLAFYSRTLMPRSMSYLESRTIPCPGRRHALVTGPGSGFSLPTFTKAGKALPNAS